MTAASPSGRDWFEPHMPRFFDLGDGRSWFEPHPRNRRRDAFTVSTSHRRRTWWTRFTTWFWEAIS